MAGLRGGSGKTTLCIGLAAALVQKGLPVAPFKKGPDYIDAGWLAAAAQSPCHNLDTFLIDKKTLLASFVEHAAIRPSKNPGPSKKLGSSKKAGIAIIEGNRGLFDGMDAEGTFSTAELAKALSTPVILIVDCTKATATVAAMVLGAEKFRRGRGVSIAGIVLNQIAGARHERIIRGAIEANCKTPVIGAIPRLAEALMPERHMGLTPRQEHPEVSAAISNAREIVKNHVDLGAVLKAARSAPPLTRPRQGATRAASTGYRPKIGVIRDSAFQFYYPENLDELKAGGAEIIEISALTGGGLPREGLDALYIGGGFPETHAVALSRNSAFKRSLVRAIERGLPVYAECGGLMYLGESLVMGGGRAHKMAGVFPVSFSLQERPVAHGYTVLEVQRENPYYKRGTELRGHEFHYSRVTLFKKKQGMSLVFKMKRGQGIIDKRDGLCYKNVLATYTHVHALGCSEWVQGMLKAARADRK